MIFSALFELSQTKQELYQIMKEQTHALLESLIIASHNTLLTNEYLEDLAQKRLMNNAGLIKKLFEQGVVSNRVLKEIGRENDINRINIFNRNGVKIFSNHQQEHFDIQEKNNPAQILSPIFRGETDTLIIGLKPARFESGFRYAVALSTKTRDAIVLNIDARQLLDFKQNIGFGALLRNVASENTKIIYVALQDSQHILAASGNVTVLEAIDESEFLTRSLRDSVFITRTAQFDSLEVFEAVHPFSFKDNPVGLFRVGLSMDPINDINQRIYRRLIIITVVLIVLGSFMLIFIFTRQKYSILQKQYEVVETYSGNIISHVSDAVIVYDQTRGIKIFNLAAERLFKKKKKDVISSPLENLSNISLCQKILEEPFLLQQVSCVIGGETKYLLISKSRFQDSEENENIILVMRDLTEQHRLQEQMEREQRLTAMGELASGVAHEIRNPLNTISTIIQQLDKDFKPVNDVGEYHDLTNLVISEVKRINETVQEFLRFARPEPIQPKSIDLAVFFKTLSKQYQYFMDEHKIDFNIELDWRGKVLWDERQIRQVFINLIQNAVEAIRNSGKISIALKVLKNKEIEIRIADDGPGMNDSVRENIFNLYYTTKASGTGIGLSIVQRIIYEHGGIITVESSPGDGTVFIILLPQKYNKS